MEATIQNLFSENPYFAFAGFVALVAVSLYIIKKLKNVIIGLVILLLIFTVYLYRTDVLSGELIGQLVKARSIDEVEMLYNDFLTNKKDELKVKTKEKILNTLTEDLE